MAASLVTYTLSGAVGYIALNRPPVNSYDINFINDLDGAIDAANADSGARTVVLRSASEKFFSAGADIKAFLANDTKANMKMIETAHAALAKMADSPKVFIAAIAGYALGGGLEMALAADLRLAAEGEYKMGLPEATLGLLPGNGGTQRMARLVGPNKALELMLTGSQVTPAEAERLGIVNKILPAATFAEEVDKYAQKLAKGATMAQAHIKRCVHEGIHMKLADGLALERKLIEPLFDSQDGREGLTAFTEKRAANFTGK